MTFAGSITGAGPLQIGLVAHASGANGTVELTGTSNTYSGGTVVVAATLRIPADDAMPPGTLTLNAGTLQAYAPLAMDRAVVLTGSGNKVDTNGLDVTIAGVVSGTSLNKVGTGTLTLTAANTYSGGTTISAGTLQIGSGGTSGVLSGDVTDNAATPLQPFRHSIIWRHCFRHGYADSGRHRDARPIQHEQLFRRHECPERRGPSRR